MDIKSIIREISESLASTFAEIDIWFSKEEDLRNYKPKSGGWNINEVLEHIALTNHFLLILIEKGTK
ncbi:MAG: DinB family protein, partial [Bacteroidia bacterium]|nr:DinB family protein [Bacteroidia bacterium]